MQIKISRGHITLITDSPIEEAFIEDTLGLTGYEKKLRLSGRGSENMRKFWCLAADRLVEQTEDSSDMSLASQLREEGSDD
jgi:hypothetical protein